MNGYSGADIDSVVREAGLNALRRDSESDKVVKIDFLNALEVVKPSITDEMIRWYQETNDRLREQIKPPMDIA